MPVEATAIVVARLKPLQFLLADSSGIVYASMYLSSLSPVVLCYWRHRLVGEKKRKSKTRGQMYVNFIWLMIHSGNTIL